MDWIKSIEPGDWGTFIAAMIAFVASLFTIKSSNRSAKKTDALNEKLGLLQANTQDKQRIVENIGSQRVVWINNVREIFVEFNSCAQKLHFEVTKSQNQESQVNLQLLTELSEGMIKNIYNMQLFLNGEETYSKAAISIMGDFRKSLLSKMEIDKFNYYLDRLVFIQNVILKSEWKRVKKETEKGEFLTDREVERIFEDVSKGLNPEFHIDMILKYGKQK